MNCRQAEHQIFAERDGALDDTQRAALVLHVGQCTTCQRLRENFAITVETWRTSVQRVSVPDAELEWHKVRREIRGGAGSVSASRRRSVAWFAVPLAAAAAVAVGLFVNQGAETAVPSAATQTVARAAGGGAENSPTVVFVDDKSGWTFVVAADEPHRG